MEITTFVLMLSMASIGRAGIIIIIIIIQEQMGGLEWEGSDENRRRQTDHPVSSVEKLVPVLVILP